MTATTLSACPECSIDVASNDVARLGEIVECAGCNTELEVVALGPITYAVAPEVEEDWGE